MLGENLQTVRENEEIFIKASKDIGLDVNFEEIKYMIIYLPKCGTKSKYQCSAQGQVFHCKRRNQGCNCRQRQVFHCKLRNQDTSCCFRHPTLSLASEQILKDLKRTQGHQYSVEERRVDLANCPSRLHRNSPQELNIISIRVLEQIRDPEIPISVCPSQNKYYSQNNIYSIVKSLPFLFL